MYQDKFCDVSRSRLRSRCINDNGPTSYRIRDRYHVDFPAHFPTQRMLLVARVNLRAQRKRAVRFTNATRQISICFVSLSCRFSEEISTSHAYLSTSHYVGERWSFSRNTFCWIVWSRTQIIEASKQISYLSFVTKFASFQFNTRTMFGAFKRRWICIPVTVRKREKYSMPPK